MQTAADADAGCAACCAAIAAVYVARTSQLLQAASKDVKRCVLLTASPALLSSQACKQRRSRSRAALVTGAALRCNRPCRQHSPELRDPASVCASTLTLQGVTTLALSPDQLLLAAVAGASVHVHSLPALLQGQGDAPVAMLALPGRLLAFAWRPAPSGGDAHAQPGGYLALTADRLLLTGSLASGCSPLAEGVEAAAWSPDGRHIAYASGRRLVVTAPGWADSAFSVDLPPPEGEGVLHTALQHALCRAPQCAMCVRAAAPRTCTQTRLTIPACCCACCLPDGDGELVLDGLLWPAPRVLAASSLWYDADAGDEPEGSDGYLLGLTWQAWGGDDPGEAPVGLDAALTSYVVRGWARRACKPPGWLCAAAARVHVCSAAAC